MGLEPAIEQKENERIFRQRVMHSAHTSKTEIANS